MGLHDHLVHLPVKLTAVSWTHFRFKSMSLTSLKKIMEDDCFPLSFSICIALPFPKALQSFINYPALYPWALSHVESLWFLDKPLRLAKGSCLVRCSSLPVRIPTLFPGHPTRLGSVQAGFIAVFEVLCLMFSECVYKIHSKVIYRLLWDYLMFGIFPVTIHSHPFISPSIKTCIELPLYVRQWARLRGVGTFSLTMQIIKNKTENTVRWGVGWHLKEIPWKNQWNYFFLGGQGWCFLSWKSEAPVLCVCIGWEVGRKGWRRDGKK